MSLLSPNPLWTIYNKYQPKLDYSYVLNFLSTWFTVAMNNEGLNRTSIVNEDPTRDQTPRRVNVDVLKQRLIEQKRKDKVKRTIILSTVVVSLGALTMLTY